MTTVAYVGLLGFTAFYWLKSSQPGDEEFSDTKVSIVIVARNEASNIGETLQSIVSNDYPKQLVEIILIDDHSEDGTIAMAQELGLFNLRILSLGDYDLSPYGNAFKKAALDIAISQSTSDLILTTDADCLVGSKWISDMVGKLKENDLVTGVIDITSKKTSWISTFQRYDNIATMAITKAGIESGYWYSGNTANMGYTKSLFASYTREANYNQASGDDVNLVQFAIKEGNVAFLKSKTSMVTTAAVTTISQLYDQRVRWATKTSQYQHSGLQIVWGLIGIADVIFLGAILFLPFANYKVWYVYIALIIIRIIADYIFAMSCSLFYNNNLSRVTSLGLSFLHPIYVVVIGITSLFRKKYQWKGRVVE